MNIVEVTLDKIKPVPFGYHILTYAEDGFSPFDIYTRKSNLDYEDLKAYVMRSNEADKVITLHPLFNLSIIPRRFVRGLAEPIEVYEKFLEFINLNVSDIKAKKVIFDFRMPQIPAQIELAIAMLDDNKSLVVLDEIFVVVP